MQCVPAGLQLMKECLLSLWANHKELIINLIKFFSKNCKSRHIRNTLQIGKQFQQRGKFCWKSIFINMTWQKSWSAAFQLPIRNKIREINFKILHNMYPSNESIATFIEIDKTCSFCKLATETILHLFVKCSKSTIFWKAIANYLTLSTQTLINLTDERIIFNFSHNKRVEKLTNVFILYGKLHIHRAKFSHSEPLFIHS